MPLAKLAERLADFAGIDAPQWVLEARVRERAQALGLDQAAYLAGVGDGGDELALLTERLRVGETRFFRHRAQFEALRPLLQECVRAAARERRPLAAWSAGCASGEDAWTLAPLLAQAAPSSRRTGSATDLSDAALAAARAARSAPAPDAH